MFQIVPVQTVRRKCSADSPSLQQYHLDLTEQNACNGDRCPGLLLTGTFPLLPFGSALVGGQGSSFCPHFLRVIPSVFPLLGGVRWVFIPNSWIVAGRCLLCMVFVVWVVCVVRATLQGRSGSLCSAPWTSAKEGPTLHFPLTGHLLPLSNCKFYLVSRRGETGFNLSLSSSTFNVSSRFMIGCGGCPSVEKWERVGEDIHKDQPDSQFGIQPGRTGFCNLLYYGI